MSERAPNSGLGPDGQRGVGGGERINHAAHALANSFWRGGGDEQYHFLLYLCASAARTVLDADDQLLAQAPPPDAPPPITAEDVRAAERAWNEKRYAEAWRHHADLPMVRVAFVADYLNRRGER